MNERVQGTEEGEGKEDTKLFRKPSDDEKFSGLAFKIMTDPFVGSLTFVRVYSVRPQSPCPRPAPPRVNSWPSPHLLLGSPCRQTIASYGRIGVLYALPHSDFGMTTACASTAAGREDGTERRSDAHLGHDGRCTGHHGGGHVRVQLG